jgi:hypothetical protein
MSAPGEYVRRFYPDAERNLTAWGGVDPAHDPVSFAASQYESGTAN